MNDNNNENLVAIIDIETTGRYPHNGTIVEIGICSLNLNNGKTNFLFDSLVRERDFYEKFESSNLEKSWVFLNSNISISDVEKAPLLSDKKKELQDIFDNYSITAYNKTFDFGFLKNRGFRIRKELACPMICATNVLKLPGYYGDFKWPSVQEAWDYFFPDKTFYRENHRAYDDAIHEADIVFALYEKGNWKPY